MTSLEKIQELDYACIMFSILKYCKKCHGSYYVPWLNGQWKEDLRTCHLCGAKDS